MSEHAATLHGAHELQVANGFELVQCGVVLRSSQHLSVECGVWRVEDKKMKR